MADVVVLAYHAVSECWPASLSVSAQNLEEQLRLLVRRGYRGATFYDAVTFQSSRKVVAVTFDDAYRSVFDLAFPLLLELRLPATVFVPTAFVDTAAPMSWSGIDDWLGGSFESELVPMSWEELRALADAGWEIGSHTKTHPNLTSLSYDLLHEELSGSREKCESELGRQCRSLAYPYGAADLRVVQTARSTGYEAACLLPSRFSRPTPLEWPRVGVYRGDGPLTFRLKVSPLVRQLRASPAWGLLDRGRRLLNAAGR